ncbi:MAG: ribose 5-phosphate isomerase B [Planctomycetota bacterium]|nr:MAG: ribose 5-phosphate isomerase B [Planctomycetota bacterium]
MKIYAGSDHAGFHLKQRLVELARTLGHEVEDLGPATPERVDYPDFGARVGRAVVADPGSRGLLVCGSGIGIAMAANKVPGVRAATVWDETSARLSRQHNDANVFAVGERLIGPATAEAMFAVWLSAEFEGGRHAARVAKITALEGKGAEASERPGS